jgi:4-aminobutyrate aminotransferase-like enzyme
MSLQQSLYPEVLTMLPGPRSHEILKKRSQLIRAAPSPEEAPIPFALDSKDGWLLRDVDGNSFIDFITGWGSTLLGAGHPSIVEAAIEGVRRFSIENSDYVYARPLNDLAEKLVEITPKSVTTVSYEISGTEAVETAAKLMRAATGRQFIISFFGQYHGESTAAQALAAQQSEFTRGMRSLTSGYIHVPYPHPYRCPFEHHGDSCDGVCVIRYIREYVTFHQVAADEIAGVFIEPILGEGGVLAPPDAFWPELVDLCGKNGWLLTLDEVETGFGRTGKMFAAEHWGIEPDLMCLAKGLSGGALPLGAVMMSQSVAEATKDFHAGGTFAGQPAACLAAREALRVFEAEHVLDHVAVLEEIAIDKLESLTDCYSFVGDVRIRGLYLAVEFVRDKGSKQRAPEIAKKVHAACLRRGLAGIQDDVAYYRGLPALNMPAEIFAHAMDIVVESIDEVAGFVKS